MVYETSYEVGRKPFRPDPNRGCWANPKDFMWACIGLALKMDICSLSWIYLFDIGIYSIIPYFICAYLYVVPLMVLQAFMGQFSSSGFISSLRIAPLFKGMGYLCLVLNLIVLFYYTLLAAVPLFFLLNSFRPTLPWSCEATDQWAKNLTDEERTNICNITLPDSNDNMTEYHMHHLPSVLYFNAHFDNLVFTENDPETASFSFELMFCILIVWGMIAAVFYFWQRVDKFGIFLRYGLWLVSVLLVICLIRFSFLPGAMNALYYHNRSVGEVTMGITSIPLFVMNCFGGGWGTITSLASHNNFKLDIMVYSWFICLGQFFIMMGLSMVVSLTEAHFRHVTDSAFYHNLPNVWNLFLSSASAISELPAANLWSILYYTMLTLSALILMCTQLFTVLTSLFDEFEMLRPLKTEVMFGVIGLFAISSLYFSTTYGLMHFEALSADALVSQTALSLLLILVVLWIYGRERFQRDIQFMLNKSLSNCRIFLLRFVVPFCLVFVLLCAMTLAYYEHMFNSWYFVITTIIHTFMPWLILPGYAIYLLVQSSGSFVMRFKRACRPNDWYPVEAEHRQKYEEAMNNMDITHQLTEVTEEYF